MGEMQGYIRIECGEPKPIFFLFFHSLDLANSRQVKKKERMNKKDRETQGRITGIHFIDSQQYCMKNTVFKEDGGDQRPA